MGIADLLAQIVSEGDLEVLLAHLDAREAELQLDVFVVDVDEVLNRLVDDVKSGTHNIDAHLAGAGDRDGIGVDHLETLLENGFLAASRRDLLFTLVTVEKILKDWIDNEAGPAFKRCVEQSYERNAFMKQDTYLSLWMCLRWLRSAAMSDSAVI